MFSDVSNPQNAFAKLAAKSPATVTPQPPLPVSVTPPPAPQTPTIQTPPQQNKVVVEVKQEPAAPVQPTAPVQPPQPIKIELNISTNTPANTPTQAPVAATQPLKVAPITTPTPNLPQITLPAAPAPAQTNLAQAATPAPAQTAPVAPAAPAQPTSQRPEKNSPVKVLFHWGAFVSLIGLGIKGFFDCLYFITVEFQNFEDGLKNQRVETELVSQLMLKASLLVFATALAIFFALQLTRPRGNKWLTIMTSLAVFGLSLFVLQYAANINVVDVFKVAPPQL